MIQRYINYAVIYDFIIGSIISFLLLKFRIEISTVVKLPGLQSLRDLNEQMIPIVTTVLGFILTIITVIITFKDGFSEGKDSKQVKTNLEKSVIPKRTFLEVKASSKGRFYGTEMHKHLIRVLSHAAIEFAILLIALLGLQLFFDLLSFYVVLVFLFCSLSILSMSLGRVLLMFYLFVNVHVDGS